MHEGFSVFKEEQGEKDRKSTNRDKGSRKHLVNIEFQCQFDRERNEAKAK